MGLIPGIFGGSVGGAVNNVENFATNSLKTAGISALNSVSPLLGSIAGEVVNKTNSSGWLAKMQARPDPHLLHQWKVTMPFGLDSSYVESIHFGLPQVDDIQIFRGGTFVYMAGIKNVPSVSMVLYEDNEFTATKWVNKWRQLIYNDAGQYNPTRAYKKTIKINPQNENWQDIVTIELAGAWPYGLPSYAFQSEILRTELPLQFRIDDIVVKVSSSAGSGLLGGLLSSVGAAFPGLSPILGAAVNTIGGDLGGVSSLIGGVESGVNGVVSSLAGGVENSIGSAINSATF